MKFFRKLSHQSFLLIAVPLLFELCFVTALVFTLQKLESEIKEEVAAREMLLCVNAELKAILSCAGNIGVYQVDRDEKYMVAFRKGVNELPDLRRRLINVANERQRVELDAFNHMIDELMKALLDTDQLMQNNDRIDLMRSSIRAQRLLKTVSDSGAKIIAGQELLNARQREKAASLRDLLSKIIIAGVFVNVALAVYLAIWVNRNTVRRLNVLSRNASKLGEEQPLVERLDGEDEIADIDRVFHQVERTLAEARRKEKALTENALDVICSLDREGRFTKANKAVSIWGYTVVELVGTSLYAIVAPTEAHSARAAIENIITQQGSGTVEISIKRPDESICENRWSIQWSDAEQSLFCVAHDISERKRVERMKQDVVAMVSHDLRAPLTSIMVLLDLFEGSVYGELNASGLRKVTTLKEQVDRLILMINDLIDIERLDDGAFEITCRTVESSEIVRVAVDAVQSSADRRKIGFEIIGEPLSIWCDDDRIVRALVNLLSNAIKFSPDGSTVAIAVSTASTAMSTSGKRELVEFRVTDNGSGIAAEKLATIFERFKQANPTNHAERQGSGLGLAICKAIVEAHEGTVTVESKLGEGSSFCLRIPLSASNSKYSLDGLVMS